MVFLILLLLLILVPIFFLFHHNNKHNGQLPPGSLGLPVIGQSIGLLKALKADRVEKWFHERITKYGPVWKASLFGYPTVVLNGPTANKFIYTCDGNILANTQPPSISRILGSKNILELSGNDHKRVRSALVSFLKLDVLKQYVAKVDEEVQHHLLTHWHGKHEVQVQPLIKILTFNVICSLLFGIERGHKRENLLPLFQDIIEGVLSIPINLPFTQFRRGIIARKKLVPMISHIIREKREALKEQDQQIDSHKDLITSLLNICDDDGSKMMSEDEIIDNIIIVMVAGYDTTSVLLTFLVRLLANNKSIYSAIVQGLPVIGQSIGLLKALKADKVDKWFQERITKHGQIWKASLFGYPTVVLHGPTANKFIYTCDGNLLTNTQPPSISRILGTKNIIELCGNDHKRVRAALVSFLKLEVLKQYVAKVDEEVQHHLLTHWHGKHEIKVQPLIKILTFNVICSLLFGIERGPQREKMLPLFQDMIEGVLSIPVNLPFTQFSRGIIARKKLVPMILQLIREKKHALKEQNQQSNPHRDLITSLLSIRDSDGSTMMSEEEIIDNIIVVMVAGYDTTSVLLTFLVRLLANNKAIYHTIVQEQQEIIGNKASEEALTWEDLTKMKYTWRVATEMMRINPPVILSFRRAKQDIEYGGFVIPKGWQVLLSASMTHMNDSIFQNPAMFDPTRFEKHAPTPPAFSYVAFGGGPRMCPGIELAKMETLVMMHRLVTRFTWELLKKDESFKRVPMPEFDQGLLVHVQPLKENGVII